ncbi:MAG: cell division protein ZapA [Clostridia bacterium]|nr:cell division protein ZapA [Clostridia bacterium]
MENHVEKIRTVVRVAGREYTLAGTDTEEHMHRVAGYVDRKMEELTLTTRMPSNMVAVLAAMNVADELLKSQDENNHLRKEMVALQQQIAKLKAQGTASRPMAKPKGGVPKG